MITSGLRVLALGVAGLLLTGAPTVASAAAPALPGGDHRGGILRDLGNRPALIDVEQDTLRNKNFRTARWTASDLQLTLMSIPVGGDVGLERHEDVDQFLRIEDGDATVMMGTEKKLDFVKKAGADDAILVPHGTWHNIVNTGTKPLKLYSLYGPAHHPFGTVHKTQKDDPGSKEPKPSPAIGAATPVAPFTVDPGHAPMVLNIADATTLNNNYRTAAWTGDTLQLTLMSLNPKEDIGLEMHEATDQFIRVEGGTGMVLFGDDKDSVRKVGIIHPGDAVLIPAGTWHNVVNVSGCDDLRVYSIYGPAQHPKGTVQPTKPVQD